MSKAIKIEDYLTKLKKLKVDQLKNIVRHYLQHLNIKLTGIKKDYLIFHLLKHTELIDNKIYVKSKPIGDTVKDVYNKKPNKTKDEKPIDKMTNEELLKKYKRDHTEKVKPVKKVKLLSADKPEYVKITSSKSTVSKNNISNKLKPVEHKKHIYSNDYNTSNINYINNNDDDNISFIEYLEPNKNYVNHIYTNQPLLKDIVLKIGSEINKSINVKKLKEIIDDMPYDIFENIYSWADKKSNGGEKDNIEYLTFVKKVIYNMFLKKYLDKLKVNTFDGIAISNMIAHDAMLRGFFQNNDETTIYETFLKMNPMIPNKDFPINVYHLKLKLFSEYEKGKFNQ